MKLLPTYFFKKIVSSKTPSEYVCNSNAFAQYILNHAHFCAQKANNTVLQMVGIKQ